MRLAVLLTALILGGPAGAAEGGCEFDLAAAREAALAAGPARTVEHFIASDGKSVRWLTIVIDVIRPDRMRRISIFQDGSVGHMVLIAGQGWSGSIKRGWQVLNAAASAKMLEGFLQNSPWPATSGQATCEQAPGSDGKMILKYSFTTRSGEQTIAHEVLADRKTRRPVRYHTRMTINGTTTYTESDRTFQFIDSLVIEAP